MGKINSREKGKRGERYVADFIKGYGYDARRGQQFCGANGDADVVGLPGIHVEVKFVESLNLDAAMAQAIRDARAGEYPVVFHKQNRKKLYATIRTQDFIDWTTGTYFLLPDTNCLTFQATDFMEIYKALEGR